MASSQTYVTPLVPAPTDILGNTVAVGTATALITIPAGRTWKGSVAVEASATTASSSASVATAGSTVRPAAGNVLAIDATGATGGLGDSNANTMSDVYVSAGSSAATLTATIVGTGSCSVNGVLL